MRKKAIYGFIDEDFIYFDGTSDDSFGSEIQVDGKSLLKNDK